MGKETAGTSETAELDAIFHPRSVAVIGVPLSRPDSIAMDSVDSLLEFQFSGPVYLINPRGGEFKGLKVYPSLDNAPGNVDYVISLLPARMASVIYSFAFLTAFSRGKPLARYEAMAEESVQPVP